MGMALSLLAIGETFLSAIVKGIAKIGLGEGDVVSQGACW